jgi:CRISPR/Cas system-associated exonuclease Cas4 (RecB family)
MVCSEAKRLRESDVVIWNDNPADRGVVIEVNPNVAVRIKWETTDSDGSAIVGWLDHRGMNLISVAP